MPDVWDVTTGSDNVIVAVADVVAPGIHIPTTDIVGSCGKSTTDYYLDFNGTSVGAPHVSALAAIVWTIYPNLTWQRVGNVIRNNADKVHSDIYQ